MKKIQELLSLSPLGIIQGTFRSNHNPEKVAKEQRVSQEKNYDTDDAFQVILKHESTIISSLNIIYTEHLFKKRNKKVFLNPDVDGNYISIVFPEFKFQILLMFENILVFRESLDLGQEKMPFGNFIIYDTGFVVYEMLKKKSTILVTSEDF